MALEDVQRLAPTLFFILFAIILLNALSFLSYFIQDKKNKVTRHMFGYWAVQLGAFLSAPFFQEGSLLMAIPFSFTIFNIYFLYQGMFADYAPIPSYKKFFGIFFGICWPAAVALELLFQDFTITTLPLAIGIALPMLYMSWLVVFDNRMRFRSIHHKWVAISLAGASVHCLNFSFFRDDPSTLIWGTTAHILIIVMFSIVISNYYNYMLHKSENERLERLVDLRTFELKDKLEQVESLKEDNDRLFKVVLHDISNPMSAVLGYLSLLEHDKLQLSGDQQRSYVRKAMMSSETVANTIRQVRALATTEAGNSNYGNEPINLWDALHLVETVQTPLYDKKGVILDIQYPKDKNFHFYANKELFIHSVLGNLLSNSLKFSEPGSKVTLAHEIDGDNLHISVKDQGQGIKEEMIQNIFDFKSSVSTRGTSGESGHGFGLPLMKKYVDQIKGDVRVRSVEKKEGVKEHGTEFHLCLKANQMKGAADSAAPELLQ